jgi:hypothetical protein
MEKTEIAPSRGSGGLLQQTYSRRQAKPGQILSTKKAPAGAGSLITNGK